MGMSRTKENTSWPGHRVVVRYLGVGEGGKETCKDRYNCIGIFSRRNEAAARRRIRRGRKRVSEISDGLPHDGGLGERRNVTRTRI
jgi:hypothetical protein